MYVCGTGFVFQIGLRLYWLHWCCSASIGPLMNIRHLTCDVWPLYPAENTYAQQHHTDSVYLPLLSVLVSWVCSNRTINESRDKFKKQIGDVDVTELEDELQRFTCVDGTQTSRSARYLLYFIYNVGLHEIYPNLCIAWRVLLTTQSV